MGFGDEAFGANYNERGREFRSANFAAIGSRKIDGLYLALPAHALLRLHRICQGFSSCAIWRQGVAGIGRSHLDAANCRVLQETVGSCTWL